MALPNALNRDPFLTGGVMDAPDPVVRSAMAKAMNPQGLPPMTQKELNRLLGRQYLEAEDRKNQAQNATLQTMRMRQDIAAGESPAIDVRQYAGSMYAAPGSYSAARPLAPVGGGIVERSADALLKQRFGQMLPGEVEVANKRGSMMLLPEQTPEVEAPASQSVQEVSGFSGNSAIERLLGRNLSLMQGAGSTQSMGGPTPSNVFSYTPAAMGQQLAERRFQADVAAGQRKQMIETLSAMAGLGQDINQLNLPPDIISEAAIRGEKLKKEIAQKYPATKSIVRNGIVYTQRYNPDTGEEFGDLIPVRSTEQLPGTAKPQSEGILIPVRDPSGGIVPGILFDPKTREYRNQYMPGATQQMMSDYGLGGFQPGAQTGVTQQPAGPKPVKTYQQLLDEMRGSSK